MSTTLSMNPKRKHKRKLFDFQWWDLTTQVVYNVSQRKRTSLQRHSTLKLPPLYSKIFSLQALLQNLQRNTYITVFNCQNCVTFFQIVTRLVRTTQGTTNLILKTCSASWKSCHVIPKSCHDWTSRKHALDTTKIVTRWGNRVTISLFLQNTNFEANINTRY